MLSHGKRKRHGILIPTLIVLATIVVTIDTVGLETLGFRDDKDDVVGAFIGLIAPGVPYDGRHNCKTDDFLAPGRLGNLGVELEQGLGARDPQLLQIIVQSSGVSITTESQEHPGEIVVRSWACGVLSKPVPAAYPKMFAKDGNAGEIDRTQFFTLDEVRWDLLPTLARATTSQSGPEEEILFISMRRFPASEGARRATTTIAMAGPSDSPHHYAFENDGCPSTILPAMKRFGFVPIEVTASGASQALQRHLDGCQATLEEGRASVGPSGAW